MVPLGKIVAIAMSCGVGMGVVAHNPLVGGLASALIYYALLAEYESYEEAANETTKRHPMDNRPKVIRKPSNNKAPRKG
jgi:hypothetical protein